MQPTSMMRWPCASSRPVVSVSRTTCRSLIGAGSLAREQFVDGFVGELVGALVARIAAVPLDPAQLEMVALARGVEPLPELLVLHRLPVGRLPAALAPLRQPQVEPVLH